MELPSVSWFPFPTENGTPAFALTVPSPVASMK